MRQSNIHVKVSPADCCVVSLLLASSFSFVSFSSFVLLGERVLASGSVQLPRFTLLESGSLLISPSHISDAGTYTCMASNSRGIDEASADLVVWGECVLGVRQPKLFTYFKKRTCLRYVVNAQTILHRRQEIRLCHIMMNSGLWTQCLQIQKHSCVQVWSHH